MEMSGQRRAPRILLANLKYCGGRFPPPTDHDDIHRSMCVTGSPTRVLTKDPTSTRDWRHSESKFDS
jgi:hypothetical protein